MVGRRRRGRGRGGRGGERGCERGACASSARSRRDPGRRAKLLPSGLVQGSRMSCASAESYAGSGGRRGGRSGSSLMDVSMESRLSFRRRACACRTTIRALPLTTQFSFWSSPSTRLSASRASVVNWFFIQGRGRETKQREGGSVRRGGMCEGLRTRGPQAAFTKWAMSTSRGNKITCRPQAREREERKEVCRVRR